MTDSGTVPWLAEMQRIDGTKWAPGDPKNQDIEGWLDKIGEAYPGMEPYCEAEKKQDYFSWCGLTVGHCMATAGIAPVFGTSDTGRFLWAEAWLGWGSPVSLASPQPGDIVIFDFGNNDHHVSLFVKDNGNGTWACHGGNQGHQVTVSNFHKSSVMGVRRPVLVPMVEAPPVVPVTSPGSDRFNACVLLVLHDEGGNDDDPDDPGGRTSRGITETDWNAWLKTHPTLPADVFLAPQDQIVAIYDDEYWNKLSCDSLPAGVDYVVFDYGVLSGVGQSAKVLQSYVGAAVDGEIGSQTIAATAKADVADLINKMSDERIAHMQQSPVWPKYGKGWTARVQRVRAAALAMASAAATQPKPLSPPIIKVEPPVGAQQMTPDQIAQIVISVIAAIEAQKQGSSTQQAGLSPDIIQSIATAVTKQLPQGSGSNQLPKPANGSDPTTPTPAPTTSGSGQSAMSNPSVQIGALGLAIASFLQAIGTIAPPFSSVLGNVATAATTVGDKVLPAVTKVADAGAPIIGAVTSSGPTFPSTMLGTLATVIPLIVAGVGATSGWGSLLGIGSALINAIGTAAKKSQ